MTTTSTGKYRCLKCGGDSFAISSTRWDCQACGQAYPCIRGIPKLYLEETIGAQDRKLRDMFYDGLFGSWYSFLMPFIVLPVRPARMSQRHWTIYGVVWLIILGLFAALGHALTTPGDTALAMIVTALLVLIAIFFAEQKYLGYLFLLALPTKLSVAGSKFMPTETFAQVHDRVLAPLLARSDRLQVLDVSTGSCNSLYKHGWMKLNADYTAIDLSETMLSKGLESMSRNGVAVDLVLGDALNLPFQPGTFDVVLSYGALNGLSDPGKALAEMARVAKPGALLLFLDEQMYGDATSIQRAYFMKVLSSHNIIHHCPVELLPAEIKDVHVAQVYEFYYICTAIKAA